MKVTLIYPGIATCGFNSLGTGGMDTTWMNLGLAYIGACLKQQSYDVDLIDLREMKDWDDVKNEMERRDPDVFGVHMNTVNYEYALKCCKIAKELDKIVIVGGPHVSIPRALNNLIKSRVADYIVTGEGEISFVEIIQKIERGAKFKSPKIINGKRVENLDSLPFPDRDLYNIKKIVHPFGAFPFIDNGIFVIGSRGCPFNCAFCQPQVRDIFGRTIRFRSVDNIIEEIRYIVDKYKVKYISFQDDTFTVRKKWVIDLCRAIKKEKLDIQWSAQSRSNTFDEDIAKVMSEAGCACVIFGFESGSQRVLDFLRKGITPEQSLRAAELCKKYGMIIFADYMLGIPTETKEELKQTYDMIRKFRPEFHSPSFFTPVPGCDLYDYCEKNNLIRISSYRDFARNPIGEKIKGVNYEFLDRLKDKMITFTPAWFEEEHYRRMVLKRWKILIKQGYMKEVIKEVAIKTIKTTFPYVFYKLKKSFYR